MFLPESGITTNLTCRDIANAIILHKLASSNHYSVRNKHFCDTAIAAFSSQGIFIAQLTSAWFATITFTLLFFIPSFFPSAVQSVDRSNSYSSPIHFTHYIFYLL